MLVLDICRNARKHGLDVSFMATGGGALEDDFMDSGVPFFRLQRRLPFDPMLVRGIRRILQSGAFDVIHSTQPVAGIHAYAAALGLGVRHVLGFQGYYGDLKNRLAVRFLVPRMSANISCSGGLLKWLEETEGMDIRGFETVMNGADASRLRSGGSDVRRELGIPDGSIVIGMLAHFYAAPRKDHASLCRAFARLAEEVPEARLLVAGGTERGAEGKRAECERIVSEAGLAERVHFVGFRRDVGDVLSAIDINVLSSLHEGFPVSLVEAMLVGKACVLSDIAPHIEASGNGRYAELFATGDDVGLSGILRTLARDPQARLGLASRAKEHAEKNLSIGAHLEALKRIYSRIP